MEQTARRCIGSDAHEACIELKECGAFLEELELFRLFGFVCGVLGCLTSRPLTLHVCREHFTLGFVLCHPLTLFVGQLGGHVVRVHFTLGFFVGGQLGSLTTCQTVGLIFHPRLALGFNKVSVFMSRLAAGYVRLESR